MLAAAKWTLAIIPSGIALGALLGAAAHPEMKDAPEQWWQLTWRDEIAVSSDRVFAASWPEDLNPGGYRPDLDYEAEWSGPVLEYELAALGEEAPDALPDDLPTVSYGIAEAVDAGVEAQAVAEAAEAAQALEPEPAAEPEMRKSELVVAGLY